MHPLFFQNINNQIKFIQNQTINNNLLFHIFQKVFIFMIIKQWL